MSTKCRRLFAPILATIAMSSCSVVDKRKMDGFAKLDIWKDKADLVHSAHNGNLPQAYSEAASAINQAVSIKSQELLAAGDAWLPFAQVDGSLGALQQVSPGIELKVNMALESAKLHQGEPLMALSEAAVIAQLLELARKAAVEGRNKEATAISNRLETYKWKE